VVKFFRKVPNAARERSVIRLPSFEAVSSDAVLYAHASRILHWSRTRQCPRARAAPRRPGGLVNPPPLPLATEEMDAIYELPYARRPHPKYGAARIPAYHMIRFSVSIQRGCFGGCTFCSITSTRTHHSEPLRGFGDPRDRDHPRYRSGFTGVVSDLGGPTANMYRLHCKSTAIESACRRPRASIRASVRT